MLRMGRSPRADQINEGERQAPGQTPPQPAQAAPAAQHTPQPQTQTPSVNQAAAQPPARPEHSTPSTPRAVSETESLARELKEGIMSGFVGSNTVLTGEAEFKGMLRVDGRFSGRISSEKGTLIVSAGGTVEADVRVGTARVNGTVNGDIVACERIELGRSAKVHGNIQTPVLVIEQGAVFEGSCRMTQTRAADKAQPKAERPAAARPEAAPKPRVQSQQPVAARQNGSPSVTGAEELTTPAVSPPPAG